MKKADELNFDDKGFDKEAFMEYMQESFYGMENSFTRELVENIIEYAHKHEQVSKDQFAYFVSDMIPEIEFREVAAFCNDKSLTSNGITEKESFWQSREQGKALE